MNIPVYECTVCGIKGDEKFINHHAETFHVFEDNNTDNSENTDSFVVEEESKNLRLIYNLPQSFENDQCTIEQTVQPEFTGMELKISTAPIFENAYRGYFGHSLGYGLLR